jgi:hypothetical protein
MKGRHPFESCLQQQGNWVSSNLLPNDTANISKDWSVSVPGKISDKNFLQAGYHYGRDTVGSSLRNANMQLRSEPIIPKVDVSPWMNSTMEPDEKRRRFDLQDF